MTPLTKAQIIDETIKAYTTGPRGLCKVEFEGGRISQSCVYHDAPSGAMCAVGRCLMNAKEFQQNFSELGLSDLPGHVADNLDELLKPEYRGHDLSFWTDLQNLHDDNSHWDKNGLTLIGQVEVDHLRRAYCE